MAKRILKQLKGKTDIDSLLNRWAILNEEERKSQVPLRVSLEKHQVEHMIMKKLKRVM